MSERGHPNWTDVTSVVIAALTLLATLGIIKSCSGPSSGSSATAGPGATKGTTSAPATSPASPRPGTKLTSYKVTLADQYGIDFGPEPAKPVPNQDTDVIVSTDLDDLGSYSFGMLASLNGQQPSYAACEADQRYTNDITQVNNGTTGCWSGNGFVAGFKVYASSLSTVSTVGTGYFSLVVTVWQGS